MFSCRVDRISNPQVNLSTPQNLLWLRLRGCARLRQQGQVQDRELADRAVHETGHNNSLLDKKVDKKIDR